MAEKNQVNVEFIVKARNGRIIHNETKTIEPKFVDIYSEGLRVGASLRIKDAYVVTNHVK